MLCTIFSSTDDFWAIRNGDFIPARESYSYLADIGYRGGVDTHHSRAKSNLARDYECRSMQFCEEVLC
jgi:hypothetical protein